LRAIKPSFPAAYRESLIDFPSELRNSKSFSTFDDRTLCDHEERRLFYVAMTRARDTLTIYAPFGRGERDNGFDERTLTGVLQAGEADWQAIPQARYA